MTDQPHEEEQMDTATAEAPPRAGEAAQEVLETIRVRMEAERAAAARRATETAERVKARAAQLAADHAGETVEYDDAETWEDPRELQARVRATAWHRDLAANDMSDLAGWTLDRAANGEVLGFYVEAIGPDAPYRNAILAGGTGTGKTSAAIAAGNAAVARGLMARIVTHARYLGMLRPDGSPEGLSPALVRSTYRRCEVLILDDFGAELDTDKEATEFVRRETNELLGDRLTAGRATIVTTNLTSAQLEAILGDRIMSRLGAKARVIRFSGPDHRKPVTW